MTETAQNPAAVTTKMTPQMARIVTALIVGGIAAILDSTMVTLAIHTLVVDLHSSADTIQWVTTGYLLAVAVAIPLTGWAEARIGGKRLWLLALTLFVVASVLCATAWNDASLIAFRVLQGLGGGMIFPLLQTIAVRAAGGRPSPSLMATVSLPAALGPILGPVIGGLILNSLSWRWLFLVNVPIVAVGLVLAIVILPRDRPVAGAPRPVLDLVGLLLVAPGLAGVLLGLSQLARDGGIGHAEVLAPLIVGIALLVVFVVRGANFSRLRTRASSAIVDVRLFRLRSMGSASAVFFTAGAALYSGMFLLPLYFQELQGRTVLVAGLLMIPQGLGTLAARFVVGKVVERIGARAVSLASFVIAALATVPFAFADAHTNLWWLGVVLFVRGLGVGAVLIPAMSVAYADVPQRSIADASMATRIVQQVGSSFGTAIVAVALQGLLAGGPVAAFQGAFWWSVGISVVALVPAVLLPGVARRDPAPAKG